MIDSVERSGRSSDTCTPLCDKQRADRCRCEADSKLKQQSFEKKLAKVTWLAWLQRTHFVQRLLLQLDLRSPASS